jgi:hypothetical protein
MAQAALSKLAAERLSVAIGHTAEANELVGNINNLSASVDVSAQQNLAIGSLSQAQIQTLHSVGAVLVAAPAAGTAIIVDEVHFKYNYSTAAFTGGGVISLAYTSGATIMELAASLLTGGSSIGRFAKPSVYNLDASTGTATGFDLLSAAAEGLSLSAASADFAAGNAASTLDYRIKYRVVTVLT